MAGLDLSKVKDEETLEAALSEPYAEDVEAAADLQGGLLVLGAGGKMGPTLVRRAVSAMTQAGVDAPVVAVSRFTDRKQRENLEQIGAQVISADLMDPGALESLPSCRNVVFMAGMKFGSSQDPGATWAMNCYLPGRVAERFRGCRIVAFSTGNVYPLVPPESGGCKEDDNLAPVGEYAQSCLGRERVLSYFARTGQTPITILRLNYAVEARYGVLLDIGRRVLQGHAVSLAMGYANVIWQGDANSVCLRSFRLCDVPAAVLNLTGAEILSVRSIAESFARHFGRPARFTGSEGSRALLSDATRCHREFGPPRVAVDEMVDLVAGWLQAGGVTWEKPTKFEVIDGKF